MLNLHSLGCLEGGIIQRKSLISPRTFSLSSSHAQGVRSPSSSVSGTSSCHLKRRGRAFSLIILHGVNPFPLNFVELLPLQLHHFVARRAYVPLLVRLLLERTNRRKVALRTDVYANHFPFGFGLHFPMVPPYAVSSHPRAIVDAVPFAVGMAWNFKSTPAGTLMGMVNSTVLKLFVQFTSARP